MDDFDWQQFQHGRTDRHAMVDPRRRLRLCGVVLLALFALVLLRAVQLETSCGEAYRAEAASPLRREKSLPGVRGRILGADGTVLAVDREIHSLAVHYRYLQEPADEGWLRYTARRRLAPAERKDPARLEAEQQRILAERREMARRLCDLCKLGPEQWQSRARAVQARVEHIAETVNRRYRLRWETNGREPQDSKTNAPAGPLRLSRLLHEALQSSVDEDQPRRITVAEELDYHVMADDVPLSVVAEIEGHPQDYPGVKIVSRTRRSYPCGSLAAHVLGYLGRVGPQESPGDYHPEDYVGRCGVEARYEHLLRGRRGLAVELVDRTGRLLSRFRQREPGVGRDVVLTIHPSLQRTAEALLDSAVKRRGILSPGAPPGGGAVVVMDVESGAIRAAASTPRFDPNLFLAGDAEAIGRIMQSPERPLFDRSLQMALAPGSVFKTVCAAALLESGAVDPSEPFHCRGYLHQPDQWRCAVFVRHGIGHGDVDLARALAASCNVYFFHHAEQLGPEPLVRWARRFGFGRPTGVDLPAEAWGRVPDPSTIETLEGHPWRTGDTLALAVGQGSLTATPLQVARLMAALANRGRLVRPHVVSRLGMVAGKDGPDDAPGEKPAVEDELLARRRAQPVAGLHARTLQIVRKGLRRVVADPEGTAHATVFIEQLPVAGKTGTAETTPDRPAHAWFAGYVPADRPRFAVVAVLEYGGDASQAVGPVVKRLVLRMDELGLLAAGHGATVSEFER